MKSSPKLVPIDQVIFERRLVTPFHTRKMIEVLNRQGQIEPLQVALTGDNRYSVFVVDTHGNDIVAAARELSWPTLLVVEMRRYEA